MSHESVEVFFPLCGAAVLSRLNKWLLQTETKAELHTLEKDEEAILGFHFKTQTEQILRGSGRIKTTGVLETVSNQKQFILKHLAEWGDSCPWKTVKHIHVLWIKTIKIT